MESCVLIMEAMNEVYWVYLRAERVTTDAASISDVVGALLRGPFREMYTNHRRQYLAMISTRPSSTPEPSGLMKERSKGSKFFYGEGNQQDA